MQEPLPLLFGCLACLIVTSVVTADGRVFVLNLQNSTSLPGSRDAERACASLRARLASSAELRHAVAECFFSPCTRGWLYGGLVGTTVCNAVGSSLKAVDVKTEDASEDVAHLDAFCVKDKGEPCGDPPSFPNARLQQHSGYEMGDELLYTCVPGYAMSSGHRAFSLLCDSCGEWYGLVEMCVKDHAESHIDYEDKFTDSYGEEEHHNDGAEVHEKVHGVEREIDPERQETNYDVEAVGKVAGGRSDDEAVEDRAVEDFTGHPAWEEERRAQVKADVASATDAPVSVLSQKHLFWFPSETFQEQVRPASTEVISQTTQRTSSIQSEESKERESQEVYHHQSPIDADDVEPQGNDDHDEEDHNDHDDHSDHDDQDDPDSHQEEGDHQHQVKHYISAHDLAGQGRHEDRDDHDDHYDMGEHEEERGHARYGSQEFDEDDTYDEHESYEDHKDAADDHDDDGHPDGSQENPDEDDHDDHGDGQEHLDHNDHNASRERDDHDDRNDDQEHYDHDDHDDSQEHDGHDDQDDHDDSQEQFDQDDHDNDQEHYDHDDHEDSQEHRDHDRDDDNDDDDGFIDQDDLDEPEHDDHDSYEHHDSHEDLNGQQHHVIFSIARDEGQNRTEGVKATTDETWLDGYPVNAAESENGESTTERVGLEDGGTELATSLPVSPESPAMDQWEEKRPSHVPTDDSSLEHTEAVPTRSWLPEVTKDTFTDHSPPPPVRNRDSPVEEQTMHGGESGQREGEIGEATCTGQSCPPVTPAGKGPKVAAIIVVVCLVAIAALLGVWYYRRQQQKSSIYEMNGKGQSPMRPSQQMEMQQKV